MCIQIHVELTAITNKHMPLRASELLHFNVFKDYKCAATKDEADTDRGPHVPEYTDF